MSHNNRRPPSTLEVFVNAPTSEKAITLPFKYRQGVVVVQYLPNSRVLYFRPLVTEGCESRISLRDTMSMMRRSISDFAKSQEKIGVCCLLYGFIDSAYIYRESVGEPSITKINYHKAKLLVEAKLITPKSTVAKSIVVTGKPKEKLAGKGWHLQIPPSRKPNLKPSFLYKVIDNINVNCIFVLEDKQCNNERFECHLRRFATDTIPVLPRNVLPIDGDSPVGAALLRWKDDEEVTGSIKQSGTSFRFRVVGKRQYVASIRTEAKNKEGIATAPDSNEDLIDNSKHANGHLAREEKGWGSLPMHDSYGDESTGKERDFEDYAEYSTNYAE